MKAALLVACAIALAGAACGRSTVDAVPAPAAAPEPAPVASPAPPANRFFPGRGSVEFADRVDGPVIQVELARTEAEREHGLMFRRTMADDHGMLFLMPYDNDWVFYMRNTYLRLDMVFIDKDWRVAGVVANVPPLTEDHRSVGVDSRYVLELTAHTAAKLGMRTGTKLRFVPAPDATAPIGP